MDKIAILDFGGQYAHLIANRIRRLGVYSEILDGATPTKNLTGYRAIVLSGGPASVSSPESIKCDPEIFGMGIPVLAICYGHQLTAQCLGGTVDKGQIREYGPTTIHFHDKKGVFEGVHDDELVRMSHFDQVVTVPDGFSVVASTDDCPIAGMVNYQKSIYCIQFHPEVTHTACGNLLLENFVNITGAKREWNMETYIDDIIKEIQEKVGNRKVFLMISGGVDSTVAYLLLDKALGKERVYGLFVDTGFMRLDEKKEVEQALKKVGVTNLHMYDGAEEYFSALKGVYDPEEKRRIMGDLFLDIQVKVANSLNLDTENRMLGQGTIYPDTIESGGTKHADKIKTHHNQVERIKKLTQEGKVIEPLYYLYKDEVRMVGAKLGLDEKMVWRHPFPGPGLAIRILCAEKENYPENREELDIQLNGILASYGGKAKVLPIKSVGVQGDERTYRHPAVLYGKRFSWDELRKLSTLITNQFTDINRVLYNLYPDTDEQVTIQSSYLTKELVYITQKADKIVMDYLLEVGIDREIWQFPTVLIPLSVGNTTDRAVVLRPVCSQEAMTANFYEMEVADIKELTERLRKVEGISAIFYDITNKPPGTIEWE